MERTKFLFDHFVILTPDLPDAVRRYGELGFTVSPGGKHAGGKSENAIIAFSDGTYLELLAFIPAVLERKIKGLAKIGLLPFAMLGKTKMAQRFIKQAASKNGLIDFAVRPAETAARLNTILPDELNFSEAIPGSRIKPDGQEVHWEMAFPKSLDAPFVCADLTPHNLRVPEGAACEHANGVLGVESLEFASPDFENEAAFYQKLFGGGIEEGDSRRQLRLGGSSLVLTPARDGEKTAIRFSTSSDGGAGKLADAYLGQNFELFLKPRK